MPRTSRAIERRSLRSRLSSVKTGRPLSVCPAPFPDPPPAAPVTGVLTVSAAARPSSRCCRTPTRQCFSRVTGRPRFLVQFQECPPATATASPVRWPVAAAPSYLVHEDALETDDPRFRCLHCRGQEWNGARPPSFLVVCLVASLPACLAGARRALQSRHWLWVGLPRWTELHHSIWSPVEERAGALLPSPVVSPLAGRRFWLARRRCPQAALPALSWQLCGVSSSLGNIIAGGALASARVMDRL